ncbi:putative d-arabinitol 2-dehydrogenase [Diaporthe ampelina]|uniref:Putative d-arabinitol 2-dehydrogenase n=1 Tax=Diaporthe ampelina TaxID=1214573 RepID=A0A0G2F6U6_9PEZI|nr:putative d-arabinitol 2-dehydrogenase [Diaporthe ampelina]
MFVARNISRVARLAPGQTPALKRAAPASQRSLTISYPYFKANLVSENQVPATVYSPEGKMHAAIPVRPEDRIGPAVPVTNEMVHLTTLSDESFQMLPATVKSMTVKGKVIIVTGGARGLGNFMARACAEAGAKAIALFDANQDLGDASAAELHAKTGLPVTFYKVDVRDGGAINAAVQSVSDTYGVPDVLVNSAGIADSNLPAETYDAAMFRRLVDINLTGSFLMSQAVGRAAIAAGKGASIVLVASMSGSIVNYPQEQSCYNASKAGVVQLGRSLAAEWAKYNIRVNCISPGYMDTALNRVPALDAQKKIWKGLTPQARLGNVDELNGLCVFLASDASSFMTGSNCIVDGGYSLY